MPPVVTAIGGIVAAFNATAFGAFLIANPLVGSLLKTLAASALRAALTRKPSTDTNPGIRTSTTLTGAVNPASFVLGRYATEGTLVCPPMSQDDGGGGPTPNARLTYVIELGDVPGQTLQGLILDGEEAIIGTSENPSLGFGLEGRFAGRAWVKFYDGTQTAADPGLLLLYGNHPDRPWVSDMIGQGICYAILTFHYDREVFPTFPEVRFVLGGIPLYDPRKDSTVGGTGAHRYNDRSTWEPSENPAVQIYNIKRGIDLGGGYVWGGGADANDLPLANWWAAMNTADVQIDLSGGGTEPQYRASFEVMANDEPAGVIDQLLNACSGEVAENGGVWKIRLGGPGLPVFFFTDDDIIVTEPEEYSPFRAEQEPYNAVQITHPDPDALWEPRDAPARFTADFALADPAQRRVADLSLPAAPYPKQVQRVARAYIEEEQRVVRHVLSLPPDALVLEQLDVVSWTSARRGYVAKAFEVDSLLDPLVSGTPRVTLKERDPQDAAWLPAYELPVAVIPTGVTALPALIVSNFAVATTAIEDENGVPARPALTMTWDGAGLNYVRAISFEIEAADGTSIITASSLDVASGIYTVSEAILPDKAYRVRAIFVVARPVAYTDWENVTSLDLRVRPDDLDQLAMSVAGLAVFGGTLQSDDFVTGVSGWQINKDGSMELQSLVTRDWIQEGALSDGLDAAFAGDIYSEGVTTVWQAPIGEMRPAQLWHLAFSGQIRNDRRVYTGFVYDQNQAITTYYYNEYSTRLLIDFRGETGGVFGNWIPVYDSGFVRSASWIDVRIVEHLLGDFDIAEARIRLQEGVQEVESGFVYSDVQSPNWRDFSVSMRAALS